MLTFIRSCAEDKSWRMRYMLADKIVDIAKCMDKESVVLNLVDLFANFLQDPEAEIRTIASTRSADFCKFLDSATIIRKVIPALKKLSTDTFVHVRSNIAFSHPR